MIYTKKTYACSHKFKKMHKIYSKLFHRKESAYRYQTKGNTVVIKNYL